VCPPLSEALTDWVAAVETAWTKEAETLMQTQIRRAENLSSRACLRSWRRCRLWLRLRSWSGTVTCTSAAGATAGVGEGGIGADIVIVSHIGEEDACTISPRQTSKAGEEVEDADRALDQLSLNCIYIRVCNFERQ
jgi:hypothetical protein